ncbi:MAG: leucine-rich repeat protein [Bacteroidaceae bacterium]|nr:leucine-rich repeat protein [Bacteroidaceae bacterium]
MRRIIIFCVSILFTVCTLAYDFEFDGLGYTIISTSECELVSVIKVKDKITIPEKVTYLNKELKVTGIAISTFYNCSSLQKIEMPSTIKYIGIYAFANCSALQEFTFPSSISVIADNVLAGCTNLHKVIIPNSVTEIGSSAFANCSHLEKIRLPNGLKRLGDNAFLGCTNMSEIRIPQSLSEFGSYVFTNCNSLQDVYVEWLTPPYLYNQIFDVTTNGFITKTLHVPDGSENNYMNILPWANFWDIQGYVVPSNHVGDANGDFSVDVADVTAVSSYILGNAFDNFIENNADANFDGTIDVADITTIASIILTKPDPIYPEPKSLPYISYSCNDFSAVTEYGLPWQFSRSCALASGYSSESQTITSTKAWLISPPVNTTISWQPQTRAKASDLSVSADDGLVCLSFDYTIRYWWGQDINACHQVLVSTDYDGDVSKATWTKLNFKPHESITYDWSHYSSGKIGLPTDFVNQPKVYFAFVYECGGDVASTWEISNLNISETNGARLYGHIQDNMTKLPLSDAKISLGADNLVTYTDANGDFDLFDIPPGEYFVEVSKVGYKTKQSKNKIEFKEHNLINLNVSLDSTPLIENGGFEEWSSTNEATCWKSTTTASSLGAVSQSTDAHSGSYSARVLGSATANKRIAYKEITLSAGTYNIKFYAKSTGSTSTIRPGYVPVEGSAVGSYVYNENYIDVTDQWTEVTSSFTLAATTTVNLVIMNSKNPGVDVLIDDYELTTNDGALICQYE